DRGAGVCLAENSYDLLVCEPALPHPVLLSRTDIIAGSGSGEHFISNPEAGILPGTQWAISWEPYRSLTEHQTQSDRERTTKTSIHSPGKTLNFREIGHPRESRRWA